MPEQKRHPQRVPEHFCSPVFENGFEKRVGEGYSGLIASTGQTSAQEPQSVQIVGSIT